VLPTLSLWDRSFHYKLGLWTGRHRVKTNPGLLRTILPGVQGAYEVICSTLCLLLWPTLTQIQTLGSGGGWDTHQKKRTIQVCWNQLRLVSQVWKDRISLFSPKHITVLHFSEHLPATSWKPWGQKLSYFWTEKAQSRLQNGYPAGCRGGKVLIVLWGQAAPPSAHRTLVVDPRWLEVLFARSRVFEGNEAGHRSGA
jgi:hypothetical protein